MTQTATEYVIVLRPALLPKLPSPNDRMNWRTRAANTKAWREAAFLAAKNAEIPNLARVRLSVAFQAPRMHRHDADNLIAMCKPLADGLVGMWIGKKPNRSFLPGVLPDDNRSVVEWGDVTEDSAKEARVTMRIEVLA